MFRFPESCKTSPELHVYFATLFCNLLLAISRGNSNFF
jgi:hypothetical protein